MLLETKRLGIRRFFPGDFEDFKTLIVDKESSPSAIYDEAFPTSEEGLKGVLACFAGSDEFYAVCLKETGRVIGFVTLNNCGADIRNLGYCIRSDFQNQGYGREAAGAAVDYAFERLGAVQLVSGTANENIPSCRLLFRLGFVKIHEGPGSFRADESGDPIEVIGGAYELDKERYLQIGKENGKGSL